MLKRARDNVNRIPTETIEAEEGQVSKKPYAGINDVPEEMAGQLRLCLGSMHLMCLEKLWKYEAKDLIEQLSEQSISQTQSRKGECKITKPKAKMGDHRNRCQYYGMYIQEWEETRTNLLSNAPVPGFSLSGGSSPPFGAAIMSPVSEVQEDHAPQVQEDPVSDENPPAQSPLCWPKWQRKTLREYYTSYVRTLREYYTSYVYDRDRACRIRRHEPVDVLDREGASGQ